MPIPVHCSECQAVFHVGDEFAGRPGRCPECGTVLRVPGAGPADLHSHHDPDPYHTPRPVEAYEDPPPRRRRDHEEVQRADYDEDHLRPRKFDPHARAAAWARIAKGLWYVQAGILMGGFGPALLMGFALVRGTKDADPTDTGIVAVTCGLLVTSLAATFFWVLGRIACVRVPYVPARGWARWSFFFSTGAVFLFCTFFCLFVMAAGAMAGGPNPGALLLFVLAMVAFFGFFLVAFGGEVAAAVSLVKIGEGLRSPGTVTWAKMTLGLMVLLTGLGMAGTCLLGAIAGERKKERQAAQAQNAAEDAEKDKAKPPEKGPGNQNAKDKDKGKAEDAPPAGNPPPPAANPVEPEQFDETTERVVNGVLIGMLFLYLVQFSITLQKARGAIRKEIRALTGEADKDPWDADHRY